MAEFCSQYAPMTSKWTIYSRGPTVYEPSKPHFLQKIFREKSLLKKTLKTDGFACYLQRIRVSLKNTSLIPPKLYLWRFSCLIKHLVLFILLTHNPSFLKKPNTQTKQKAKQHQQQQTLNPILMDTYRELNVSLNFSLNFFFL